MNIILILMENSKFRYFWYTKNQESELESELKLANKI